MAASRERRLQAQRRDPRTQLMQVCIRLDEARRYVERDRAAERRERGDRLIEQRRLARDGMTELELLLRTYLLSQQIIDAERARDVASRAREALASDFGQLHDAEGRDA